MIKFKAVRNDDGKIVRITVKGHSGYAGSGHDIVCAAVSTATQMAVNGIEVQKLANVSYSVEDGFLDCEISPARDKGADVLLESLMITIYLIAEQYKKYLFITEV